MKSINEKENTNKIHKMNWRNHYFSIDNYFSDSHNAFSILLSQLIYILGSNGEDIDWYFSRPFFCKQSKYYIAHVKVYKSNSHILNFSCKAINSSICIFFFRRCYQEGKLLMFWSLKNKRWTVIPLNSLRRQGLKNWLIDGK